RFAFTVLMSFFFQAEDGIRDLIVTGVQTCALPICPVRKRGVRLPAVLRLESEQDDAAFAVGHGHRRGLAREALLAADPAGEKDRSEERRVGKECRWWRGTDESKKKR